MRFLVIIGILIIGVLGFLSLQKNFDLGKSTFNAPQVTDGLSKVTDSIKVVADGFDTPWAIAFLSEDELLVTERGGKVNLVKIKAGTKQTISTLDSVHEIGEGGLMGIALDPDFKTNNFVYFYYTYSGDENGSSGAGKTLNRVVRMKYVEGSLSAEEILVDKIPGAPNHNGGRIKFGPDEALYITTGDAQEPSRAQDANSLAGKILRFSNGKIEVYSLGHRNSQGITWDEVGNFWATEHGRSGAASGLDELNKIIKGNNYGWPTIEGDKKGAGMITPVVNSGANDTWAPAGIAYFNGSLFWGGLRGQALYQGVIDGEKVSVEGHFKNEFGRIREVILGPDNMLYITTSNKDGRGIPKSGDDKIIRIDPSSL